MRHRSRALLDTFAFVITDDATFALEQTKLDIFNTINVGNYCDILGAQIEDRDLRGADLCSVGPARS